MRSGAVVKRNVTVYLTHELVAEAKSRGLNLSETLDQQLRLVLGEMQLAPSAQLSTEQLALRTQLATMEKDAKTEMQLLMLREKLKPYLKYARAHEVDDWPSHVDRRELWYEASTAKLGMSREELEKWVKGDYDVPENKSSSQ